MLSHPNKICQDCNVIFCLILAYLINNINDNVGCIKFVEQFVKNKENGIHETVMDWILNESINIDNLNCKEHIGHVRWAFVMAIYFLRKGQDYEHAIKLALMKGGDTDTNCAIVGAVIGALHGVNKIPDYMKIPVLKFDVENPHSGYTRPARYNVNTFLNAICDL